MVVRWDGGAANGGVLTLSERLRDIDGANGADVPEASCFNADPAIINTQTRFWQKGPSTEDFERVVVTLNVGAPAAPVAVAGVTRLCFTPRGRMFQESGGDFLPAPQLLSFLFQRAEAGVALPMLAGIPERWVHVPPSGVARMSDCAAGTTCL